MVSIFLSMLVFAFIGAVSPGPVNIIATGAGANFGFRQALPHVVGASVSYSLVVLTTGLALNMLLYWLPSLTEALKYLGGAFLLYIAVKVACSPVVTHAERALANPPSLLQGALAQGLNPKAWLVAMSGVSLFVSAQQPAWLYLLVFCSISLIVCLAGVGTWAAIGSLIARYLRSPMRMRVFNVLMALLLAVSVLSLFV
ncbi:LysE family translocator [Agarivorans sp. B2Z047]|uniref:LysE family translocator n=1 Tax=Agarivorans sp. B2Z047 TaxID=2652721 RepID=UPI00128E2539|nr:LysE family translocator [Agarivorans sp. B2Z047]MPW28012.1 LysE family translocator [Agarivorans sp. B2Z047]UQN44156.1 LysE family translocator [Agarivorans sp. B2Z047]